MLLGSNIIGTEGELYKIGINLDELTEALTLPNPEYARIMSFNKGRFYKKIDKQLCYLKKEGEKYVVPRYYLGEISFDGFKDVRVRGKHICYNNYIILRDYQLDFFNHYCDEVASSTGLLLEAPCGHGKTLLGIHLAHLRGVQTLVVVPTYYLAKQWAQRIKSFTTATCYIVNSGDTEIPTDSNYTIVVADLFNCRVLPGELVTNIGMVILDEAHRMGAETYIHILDEIPAYYRLALTATFRRNDGVHRILKYHFGTHIKMDNRLPRPLVYTIRTDIKIDHLLSKKKATKAFFDFMDRHSYKYHETQSSVCVKSKINNMQKEADSDVHTNIITKTDYRKISSCAKHLTEIAYPTLDSYLNEHSGRRKLIISLIRKCLDEGRTVLFLSKRKDTLRALNKYFAKDNPMLMISETNKRSAEDEEFLQNRCRLILGVTQLAKEGLDIDRLDTLIIHLPMKDTEQAIGRISRIHSKKQQALCFYLLDDCAITYAVYNNAKKYFKINAEMSRIIFPQEIAGVLENSK